MPAIAYPMINGNRYDFSSIEMNFAGAIFRGAKSINYGDKLKPGKVRGMSAMVLGRTRGEYEPVASIEIFKEEFAAICALPLFASGGLGEVAFPITVMYAEPAGPVITDVLGGTRIVGPDEAHSQGGDPLTVKLELDPLWISHNGVYLVSPPALLK